MIKTKNLSFVYRKTDEDGGTAVEEEVLREINLTIEKGSFTAILGHNGSGKSTLAKHFNAILLPTGGKVYVKGIQQIKILFLTYASRRVWFFRTPIIRWLRR